MSNKLEIKKGDKFGRLSIIKEVKKRGKHRVFLCKCECGNKKEIVLDSLIYGKSKSCGCYNLEVRKRKKPELCKYGISTSWGGNKLYNVFCGIKARCTNINNKSYKHYGGRGIKCEWKNFGEFLSDMGETYKEGLQIDRIDVNGNYCKRNCRWVTNKENCNNKRNNIKFAGLSIEELGDIFGLSYSCLISRKNRHNNLFYNDKNKVTREECAAMVYRMFEKIATKVDE